MRYDLLGRQTHRVDALGGVSYMGYDEVGNLVLSRDELGNPTYFTHDGLNRSTHVEDALGGVTYMGYDSRSSAVLRVDADGRATYMAYDPARRLERQWFENPVAGESADAPVYYTYDPVGNLLTSDDTAAGLGVSAFEYDPMDRVSKKVTAAGAVYYEFDLSGHRIKTKDPNLSVNYYVHDAAGRLDRVVLDDAATAYYEHDQSGMLTRRVMPGGTVLNYYSYDVAGRLAQLDVLNDSGALVAYYAYQRNALGSETWVRRAGGVNVYYEHDALNRRMLEDWRDSAQTVYGFRWGFDAASNRVSKTDLVAAQATYFVHDARNWLEVEHVDQTNATTYYVYDSSGRATHRHSSTLATYFSHNQRDQVSVVSGQASTDPHYFSYNGVDERVRLGIGASETYLAWDGDKLLLERTAGGFPLRRYRHNQGVNTDWLGTFLRKQDTEFGAHTPILDGHGNVEREGSTSELRSTTGERLAGSLLPDQRLVWLYGVGWIWLSGSDAEELFSTPDGGAYAPGSVWTTPVGDPRDLPVEDTDDPRDRGDECCYVEQYFGRLVENAAALPGQLYDTVATATSTMGGAVMEAGFVNAVAHGISLFQGVEGFGEAYGGFLCDTGVDVGTFYADLGLSGPKGLIQTGGNVVGTISGDPNAAADLTRDVGLLLVTRRCCPGGAGRGAAFEGGNIFVKPRGLSLYARTRVTLGGRYRRIRDSNRAQVQRTVEARTALVRRWASDCGMPGRDITYVHNRVAPSTTSARGFITMTARDFRVVQPVSPRTVFVHELGHRAFFKDPLLAGHPAAPLGGGEVLASRMGLRVAKRHQFQGLARVRFDMLRFIEWYERVGAQGSGMH